MSDLITYLDLPDDVALARGDNDIFRFHVTLPPRSHRLLRLTGRGPIANLGFAGIFPHLPVRAFDVAPHWSSALPQYDKVPEQETAWQFTWLKVTELSTAPLEIAITATLDADPNPLYPFIFRGKSGPLSHRAWFCFLEDLGDAYAHIPTPHA
jgi:hypothetical protein